MTVPAPEPTLAWKRPRGLGALALGVGALLLAVAVMARRPTPVRFTLTAGAPGTTRALIAEALATAAKSHGAEARLVDVPQARSEVQMVGEGAVDFALVSGVYRFDAHDDVREVAPLYVEALHLAVKEELADAVSRDLGALRGHTVDLGPPGSETNDFARTILAFAQITGEAAGQPPLTTTNLEYDELRSRFDAGGRDALPDAVFHLGIVPARVVLPLVRRAGYRLVALPFADAMRLGALVGEPVGAGRTTDQQYVSDATIPAYVYSVRPAVPAEPLQTVGSRLLLIANQRVPADTVGLVLDAIFRSRFARIAHPPLDHSVLALPPRHALHPGTLAYLRRDQPLITNDSAGRLSDVLSIVGALVGGALFLLQWRRQRVASRRDQLFASYIRQAIDIERRISALELSATLELPVLIALQKQLLKLKSDALEAFAAGKLGDVNALSDLITPFDATREHIGDLLLHVRETLEDRAEAEGRSDQAVWREAARPPSDPPGES